MLEVQVLCHDNGDSDMSSGDNDFKNYIAKLAAEGRLGELSNIISEAKQKIEAEKLERKNEVQKIISGSEGIDQKIREKYITIKQYENEVKQFIERRVEVETTNKVFISPNTGNSEVDAFIAQTRREFSKTADVDPTVRQGLANTRNIPPDLNRNIFLYIKSIGKATEANVVDHFKMQESRGTVFARLKALKTLGILEQTSTGVDMREKPYSVTLAYSNRTGLTDIENSVANPEAAQRVLMGEKE